MQAPPAVARLGRAAAACMLAMLAVLLTPSPATAWTDGACPTADGITVIVDFRSLRSDTIVRCVTGSPGSGYEVLRQAEIDYTAASRSPGFLCRIEGVPADDPCVMPSPADAYWSYWRADRGGPWRYSQYGPATTSPPPGPVEGWSFTTPETSGPPRTAPPPPKSDADPTPTPSSASTPSPTSTPTPAPRPTATPGPTPTSTPAPPEPTAPTRSPGSDDHQAPAASESLPPKGPPPPADDLPEALKTEAGAPSEPVGVPAPARTSPSPEPTAVPSVSESLDPRPARATRSPLGALVRILVVLAVGGAAGVAARRRRTP